VLQLVTAQRCNEHPTAVERQRWGEALQHALRALERPMNLFMGLRITRSEERALAIPLRAPGIMEDREAEAVLG